MEHTGIANLAIIIATVLSSWNGFRDPRWGEKLIFDPHRILAGKEYYRLFSSAFLHADWQHLIFNMLSLYFFGGDLELFIGTTHYLAIYFGAIIGGDLLSLWLHRHHEYRALGASGGVCGIIFANVFLLGSSVGFFFVPIFIPGWLYAIIFLLASFYGVKSQRDNVGHDAHMGGAICGLLITTALYPWIVSARPRLFAAVLGISILLLGYLIWNPLRVPLRSFLRERSGSVRFSRHKPAGKFDVDKLLDKISAHGLDSLTREEREFLESRSRKR